MSIIIVFTTSKKTIKLIQRCQSSKFTNFWSRKMCFFIDLQILSRIYKKNRNLLFFKFNTKLYIVLFTELFKNTKETFLNKKIDCQ